jgi:hypothetical protein
VVAVVVVVAGSVVRVVEVVPSWVVSESPSLHPAATSTSARAMPVNRCKETPRFTEQVSHS